MAFMSILSVTLQVVLDWETGGEKVKLEIGFGKVVLEDNLLERK